MSTRKARAASGEMTVEDALEAMPQEARDTFADLAGVDRERAQSVIQLLGLGSRTVLIALGLVAEVKDAGGRHLVLTDQAFPVMLAAALSRSGLPANVDPKHLESEADAAVKRIEERAYSDVLMPKSLPVRDSIDAPTLREIAFSIRKTASQLRETPALASLLRGVVSLVVAGREPYAVIEVRPNPATSTAMRFLAYSAQDRAGRALLEGEEVRFLPAAAGSGESVAVDIQPLQAAPSRSLRDRFRRGPST